MHTVKNEDTGNLPLPSFAIKTRSAVPLLTADSPLCGFSTLFKFRQASKGKCEISGKHEVPMITSGGGGGCAAPLRSFEKTPPIAEPLLDSKFLEQFRNFGFWFSGSFVFVSEGAILVP